MKTQGGKSKLSKQAFCSSALAKEGHIILRHFYQKNGNGELVFLSKETQFSMTCGINFKYIFMRKSGSPGYTVTILRAFPQPCCDSHLRSVHAGDQRKKYPERLAVFSIKLCSLDPSSFLPSFHSFNPRRNNGFCCSYPPTSLPALGHCIIPC